MQLRNIVKPVLLLLAAVTGTMTGNTLVGAEEMEVAVAAPSTKPKKPAEKSEHIVPESVKQSASIQRHPPRLADVMSDNVLDSEVFTERDWQSPRTLKMTRPETGDSITVTYWKDGRYLRPALTKLNHFFRDARNNRTTPMDSKLIDSLWVAHLIASRTGHNEPLEITSGYRSQATNDMLRAAGYKASKNSLHIHGKAVDFRIPGVSSRTLGSLMKAFTQGGVGTYHRAWGGWVHIDTGDVRNWKG